MRLIKSVWSVFYDRLDFIFEGSRYESLRKAHEHATNQDRLPVKSSVLSASRVHFACDGVIIKYVGPIRSQRFRCQVVRWQERILLRHQGWKRLAGEDPSVTSELVL